MALLGQAMPFLDEKRTVRDWSTAELVASLDDYKANERGET